MLKDKTILSDFELDNINKLNHESKIVRLNSLKSLLKDNTFIDLYNTHKQYCYVNNHIHTKYSFSPYSPTKAIWMAFNSGLTTAGIMDHDSLGGVVEFKEAGKIAGIATTIGVEFRADFKNTNLHERKMNNPDQKSIAYIAMHGISENKINLVDNYFSKYRKLRNNRNKQMISNLNTLLEKYNIELDFDKDFLKLSNINNKGTITERHILYNLVELLVKKYGRGINLLKFLKNELKLNIASKLENYILDSNNTYYKYDILGILKSELLEKIYINATDECPDIRDVISFNKEIGAIIAYAYLGDVEDSVTGDKKRQNFEDSYLEELFHELKTLGFDAITYMPSRNTKKQLHKVQQLAVRCNFLQISGEDINSPRQPLICEKLTNNEFANLIESTWALIGHESEVNKSLDKGMFSDYIQNKYQNINERTKFYSKIGKKIGVSFK